MEAGQLWNWLGGITTIVLVGIVLSNYKGVSSILGSLAILYGAAASAAHPSNP